MAITKFTAFSAESEVCGQVKMVEWDGVALVISPVPTMAEAADIIKQLETGGTTAFTEAAIAKMAGSVTDKPPIVINQKFEGVTPDRPLKVMQEAAKAEPPKEPGPSPATPAPAATLTAAAATPPASPSEDLAVFSRLTKLGEVVAEVRRRGHEDFGAIAAYCKRLADLGDVCPVIDALVQAKNLDDRLRVHCAGKGVAGVPA